MEDSEIVDLYLNRDERAIKESSDKYGKQLRSISWKVIPDESTVEECVNDTWMKSWESIPPHEPRTWLFAFLAKITRALSVDAVRRSTTKKRNAVTVPYMDELKDCVGEISMEDQLVDKMILKKTLNDFLAGLDKKKRDMFVRRYWFMDSIKDIADFYDSSENKVKVEMFRLRAKLKEQLQAAGIPV